jgi:hypothetical protein
MISEGKTFLAPSGSSGSHLFFVILGPIKVPGYGNDPQFISVNATTIREGIPYDDACILNPGEHPFIKQKSYISYRHTRIDPLPHLENLKRNAVWAPNTDCNPELLQKIINGARISRLIPREFKRMFEI